MAKPIGVRNRGCKQSPRHSFLVSCCLRLRSRENRRLLKAHELKTFFGVGAWHRSKHLVQDLRPEASGLPLGNSPACGSAHPNCATPRRLVWRHRDAAVLDDGLESDKVSDMTTTVREFQRKFSRMRKVAAAGKEIRIRDQKTGEEFSFKAAEPEKKKTFMELAGHLAGSVKSGVGDLSTNKKHMEGFGRL